MTDVTHHMQLLIESQRVIFTSNYKTTRVILQTDLLNFEPRSSDKSFNRAGIPSPNFHTIEKAFEPKTYLTCISRSGRQVCNGTRIELMTCQRQVLDLGH
ncbi:hypothetical protein TNCV_2146621 [Trichonephila clavipes]|uniref:Uncharacterized protein n=1 Tax=Trichonephila clavipes TaxID=2585209 RepID=A0A8X6VNA2_TRICX|nr:hypothetical protein TNCV_2146621 [Trichonephila clavipes]